MALDPTKNFSISEVSTTYDASATSIDLVSGGAARFPDPATDGAFNVTWWDSENYSNPSLDPNREIVRVIAKSGDTWTITRAQEGTSASVKNTGTCSVVLAITKKTIDDIDDHIGDTSNPHQVTKTQVGLGNVTNEAQVPLTQKGASSGVAELDAGGKVPSSQLPSYVDDVVEYASFAALPVTGETGKIYVTLDDNKTYRWSGSAYVEISASLALGETSSTAYRGDRGKTAYDHSQQTSGNPHNVTKSDVGLGNADNTSDANKPVSTAQQAALDNKASDIRPYGFRVLNKTMSTIGDSANAIASARCPVDGELQSLFAYNDVAGVTGTAVYDVHYNGVSIMSSTKISIETGELSSLDATTQPVLTTTTVVKGGLLEFFCDTSQSGTAAKGLAYVLYIKE